MSVGVVGDYLFAYCTASILINYCFIIIAWCNTISIYVVYAHTIYNSFPTYHQSLYPTSFYTIYF